MNKVPNGWKLTTLGQSREEPSFWNGDIPWIRTTEVQNCRVNLEDVKEFITAKGLKNSSTKTVPKDTILLAMIGQGKTRGQVAILTFEATINQNCAAIILNNNQSPEYYFYYLLGQYENIRKSSNSAGQSNLSGSLVKSIKVLVPPLPEQIKIAEILSTWDNAINTVQKLLANSQQQKKALMQQLLTGKKRFAGFEGEWEEKRLDEISHIFMGSSPKSEFYNEDGIGLPLLQGNADIKNRKSVPRIFTSQITRECLPDDILLSVRAPVGAIASSNHHACIGRGIAAIRAKEDTTQVFLYQWLLNFEDKWDSFSQGSTFESVNSDDINNLKIKLPSLPEQQKIAAVLTTADQEIENLRAQLNHLKQEKKALMQQLLTGKRRVKIEEAA